MSEKKRRDILFVTVGVCGAVVVCESDGSGYVLSSL
jgi:hypothetical protein